ncbi:hypothetical protein JAAARDRAFT_326560 [Jaapia argillacea MUCL 33604]|uniref:F-box domain-containing protein n=1 Tax=Jaapia argillacea MUCL 33604 TaxID=933084 RepID=A0A067PLK7_9AGAM|nr:hypothetical protein JAAARDRAFT_326560 [Jaapia argillacea MUCL 33604]
MAMQSMLGGRVRLVGFNFEPIASRTCFQTAPASTRMDEDTILPDVNSGSNEGEEVENESCDGWSEVESLSEEEIARMSQQKRFAIGCALFGLADHAASLEAENKRLKSIIDSFNASRPSLKQPPAEVLRIIFLLTFPPPGLLDPALEHGPESPWSQALRDRKSILEVCKFWRDVGQEFLYRNVALRRIGQLPALVYTLESSETSLGALVKDLTLSCVVPKQCTSLFEEALGRLLNRCPRLNSISFRSTYPPIGALVDGLPAEEGAGMYFAEMNQVMAIPPMILTSLATRDKLTSLSVWIPPQLTIDENSAFALTLSFPHLQLFRAVLSSQSASHLPGLALRWSMPQLHQLTFELTGHGQGSTYFWFAEPFFKFCGMYPTVRTLCFSGSGIEVAGKNLAMQGIIERLPALIHLVVPGSAPMPTSHPTLQWIDAWSFHSLRFPKDMPGFPSFQRRRLFHHSVSCYSNLPLLFPPGEGFQLGEKRIYRLPGMDVQETYLGIEPVPGPLPPGAGEDGYIYKEPEYPSDPEDENYSSEFSETDSEYCYSSNDEEEESVDLRADEEVDEQVDFEAGLEGFRDSA